MPLKVDVKTTYSTRSDRVKDIDQHPTEPWIICALYNGVVNIWNFDSKQQVKAIQVCDVPIRAVKFISRKNWFVTGSDDRYVRIFNYNTLEMVNSFEAHVDYIRSIVIHRRLPLIFTCSDDMIVKQWNWEQNLKCEHTYEGHSHYIMEMAINDKSDNFATASLDKTIGFWQIGTSTPNFVLTGHQTGVNCVDFHNSRPYLISGAEDGVVMIWDYHNRTCIRFLTAHPSSISCVKFYAKFPIFITGSGDETVKLYQENTFTLLETLKYGLERVWTISTRPDSDYVALGYDEGTVLVDLGMDPVISMDPVNNKIILAKGGELQQVNLKSLPYDSKFKNGEIIPVVAKNLGLNDIFSQSIAYNNNGRFIAVCGEGEYTIYTAMALRVKAYGSAEEFAWSIFNDYATLDDNTIKVFSNFKERSVLNPDLGAVNIFGGNLLGVKASTGSLLSFFDWEDLKLIRSIEIRLRHVYWSNNGEYLCLTTEEAFFILKYNTKDVDPLKANAAAMVEEDNSLKLMEEVKEKVQSGLWIEDCFVYTTSTHKLNYYIGGEIVTVSNTNLPLYILGYCANKDQLFVSDKDLNIISYELSYSVLQYKSFIFRRNLTAADEVSMSIPDGERDGVGKFLDKAGYKEMALQMTTDKKHQFDIAIFLRKLQTAKEIAEDITNEMERNESASIWSRLGEAAKFSGDFEMLKMCYKKSNNFQDLLLYAMSTGDGNLLSEVAALSESNGLANVAFMANFILNNLDACVEILLKNKKIAEAAFFARSYVPSKINEIVGLWRSDVNNKVARTIADPMNYDNLFPEYEESLLLEKYQQELRGSKTCGSDWLLSNDHRNLVKEKVEKEN